MAAVIGTSVGLTGPDKVESVTDLVHSDSVLLRHDSFAYFSIEPGTSVADGNTKVENDEAQLLLQSRAYWSIKPGQAL